MCLAPMARAPVAAAGDRVKGLKPGDRVYAFGLLNPKGGFYAEYAAVKADDVSPCRTHAQAAVWN
jgi:NADPH:quinone reductase-like Zn-dependent oxidoreductase